GQGNDVVGKAAPDVVTAAHGLVVGQDGGHIALHQLAVVVLEHIVGVDGAVAVDVQAVVGDGGGVVVHALDAGDLRHVHAVFQVAGHILVFHLAQVVAVGIVTVGVVGVLNFSQQVQHSVGIGGVDGS